MKNHFTTDKFDGKDKIVIQFKDVKYYKRVWNHNKNQWNHSIIEMGVASIQLPDVGFRNDFKEVFPEAERFDNEYMAWLEVQSEGGGK